jgi:anhydro-N-acetylmuramic acid kinase
LEVHQLLDDYVNWLRDKTKLRGVAGEWVDDDPEIMLADELITHTHAEAILALMGQTGLEADELDVIGFHGQTLLHRPAEGWTWQVGDGAALARLTGIGVVNDFRSADMQAGGQGAPLAPLYHNALLRSHIEALDLALPVAVLNLGGVANITWMGPKEEDVLAFDTGPGIGLIDDWVRRHTDKLWDEDGELALAGKVHADKVTALIAEAWYAAAPPKSLDRNDFPLGPIEGLTARDGAATLTALTAHAVARSREHLPETPRQWLLAGGGRHNKAVVAALKAALGVPVRLVDELGWRGDPLEAEIFAYLAVRSRLGLPLTLPTTTGVAQPVTGGRYWAAE